MEAEPTEVMFLFLSLFYSVNSLGLRADYPFGTTYRHDGTHLDVFMALFMVCTIEIVLLKIMVTDEISLSEEPETNESQGSIAEGSVS